MSSQLYILSVYLNWARKSVYKEINANYQYDNVTVRLFIFYKLMGAALNSKHYNNPDLLPVVIFRLLFATGSYIIDKINYTRRTVSSSLTFR
ncbi:MAG: hypothetical protein H6779_02885 [Candidatus Nomurabacteria bacterium]|nr:hypothetical protein [Candidatus Nomurabacteria bacterium]USN87335.1 MAG: hypothetical protein H6779_02885 [Candidatus Nomurabacteria bacterium]